MSKVSISIKQARQLAHLSQVQAYTLLEIPRRTFQDWESGARTPPAWAEKLIVEKLLEIAKKNSPLD